MSATMRFLNLLDSQIYNSKKKIIEIRCIDILEVQCFVFFLLLFIVLFLLPFFYITHYFYCFSQFIREKYHYSPKSELPSYYAGSVYDVSLVATPILGIIVVSSWLYINQILFRGNIFKSC